MAGDIANQEDETNTINVVPLADLSLVLLIILMVMSPMVMSSMIRVLAPQISKVESKPQVESKKLDPLFIKISAEGLFLNNNRVDSEQFLAEQIAIKLADEKDRPVIVAAEDMIQVGSVVRILDLAKQSGAEKVSLIKGGTSQK